MKKILLYIPILMFAFWSCDQMEDVYDELDEIKPPYSTSVEVMFTDDDYTSASKYALADALNASDSSYASSIASDKAFNEMYKAEDYVGKVLADLFPEYNKSSNAAVTYYVQNGTPEEHMPFLNAQEYELSDADYATVGGDVSDNAIFFPSSSAVDNMNDILGSAITSPTAGDITLVTYKSSDTEPGEGDLIEANVYETDFNQYEKDDTINQDGWMQYNEVGTEIWEGRVFNGNGYMQVSAYGETGAVVAWSISPEFDLTNTKVFDYKLSFDVNAAYYTHAGLEIFISEDFDGSDVGAATWIDVTSNFTLPTGPASGYGDFANAGQMDLSAYSSIYVAFKYTGDKLASETGTFQIDNVVVAGKSEPFKEYDMYYEFDGSAWMLNNEVMVVQGFEYDEMGSPGNYNNFSSSDAPENYLPAYLVSKFPYAQEGDEATISYRYYSGGTVTMLDDYKFEGGIWSPIGTIEEVTNQFIHNGTEWLFDPTITYVLTADDYQFMVDWVIANKDEKYEGYDSRRESYFGVNAKYGNFTIFADSYEVADFDTWQEAAQAAIEQTELLQHLFPAATTQVNGVDLYYLIQFNTYNGQTGSWTIRYQVTKSGPDPEFTYIEGPTAL